MPKYFILMTQQKLNISILLGMLLVITTFKILFSRSLVTSFSLDAIYYADLSLSFLLINTSNRFIKRQIFDTVAILTYSKYFFGHL